MFLSYLSYWEISQGERISPITYQALANAMDKVSRAEEPTGYSGLTYPVALRSQENAGVCECGGPIFPLRAGQ